jgi:chloramphenicol-sensitive protein RarD
VAKSPINQSLSGSALTAGIVCYAFWGFVPLVFQLIGGKGVGAWEILAHRSLWAAPTALVLVLASGLWPQVRLVLASPRTLLWLTLSALLIGINWIVYIWAVNNGQVLATSFGYYITPLVNMAGGALVFRETISRYRRVAIAVTVLGVIVQGIAVGGLPWPSLALALAFGIYGIVRKHVMADALTGLFIECVLIGSGGLLYVLWLQAHGVGHFFSSPTLSAWLMAAGPITAIPLALFSWAARRIPLSFMAFLQFLTPSIALLIGLAEGESLSVTRAVSFTLIWCGALIATFDTFWRHRAATTAMESP